MNVDRNTPLYYFCAKWQLPDIRFLEKMIKLGADVNSRNVNGETPIFAAIFNESIRSLLLETLIEHGADVNVISVHGESILHYAVRLGRCVCLPAFPSHQLSYVLFATLATIWLMSF
jgi:ankyrin repeat protein